MCSVILAGADVLSLNHFVATLHKEGQRGHAQQRCQVRNRTFGVTRFMPQNTSCVKSFLSAAHPRTLPDLRHAAGPVTEAAGSGCALLAG